MMLKGGRYENKTLHHFCYTVDSPHIAAGLRRNGNYYNTGGANNSDTDSNSNANNDADNNADTNNDADSNADADSDTDTNTYANSNADNNTHADSNADTNTYADTDTGCIYDYIIGI